MGWQTPSCSWSKERKVRRGREGGEGTPPVAAASHLDGLPLDLHRLLPEIHADGGLGLVGEAPPGEAEGEAGLPHVGVADDDNLEDARLDAQLHGGGAQVHGGREARGGVGAAAGSAAAGSEEIHGGRQDGDIVVGSAPLCDSSSSTASSSSAQSSDLPLRRIVGHYAGGGDAQSGVCVWRRGGGRMDGWVKGGGGRKEESRDGCSLLAADCGLKGRSSRDIVTLSTTIF